MNDGDYKIKVLCFYRYWARRDGSTREFNDGVMIRVESLRNVQECFMSRMRVIVARWGYFWVGPRPNAYELSGWISENGIIHRCKSGSAIR